MWLCLHGVCDYVDVTPFTRCMWLCLCDSVYTVYGTMLMWLCLHSVCDYVYVTLFTRRMWLCWCDSVYTVYVTMFTRYMWLCLCVSVYMVYVTMFPCGSAWVYIVHVVKTSIHNYFAIKQETDVSNSVFTVYNVWSFSVHYISTNWT